MRRHLFQRALLSAAMALGLAASAFGADKQIRPFIGTTFSGETTFLDPENAAGSPNLVIGATAVVLGEVFGFDIDFADAPGFFQKGDANLVLSSHVTTLSGNVVIAAPRRKTEYGLRPYAVAGGGLMRLSQDTWGDAYHIRRVLPAFDVGGGVVGFVSQRVGIGWEVRRFQNLHHDSQESGTTFGGERLSFWRAGMALVYRF